jgi:hypothetical protein
MTTPGTSSIQKIVAELQAEVRRYQKTLDGTGVAGRSDPLVRMSMYSHVNSHLPIGWPTMPPGVLSKLRAYAQKITRRLLRWYINPLVDQQNLFNAAVAEALVSLSQQVERQERLLRDLLQDTEESPASGGTRKK